MYDFQATLLHLLGIDHEQLTFKYQGRHFRLTDVHGNLVQGILAWQKFSYAYQKVRCEELLFAVHDRGEIVWLSHGRDTPTAKIETTWSTHFALSTPT